MDKLRKRVLAGMVGVVLASSHSALAAPPERPTFNHNTADPRPNILPNSLFNFWVPYRLKYNRPTYAIGAAAYHFAPTSQEAMVWAENDTADRYHPHHQPPCYKTFYYPKPWEGLNTGPRPNTTQPGGMPQGTVQLQGTEAAAESMPPQSVPPVFTPN